MHPEQIKAAIRMKGYTASVIADHMEVSRSTVAQVINGRATSARIKAYIAQITGLSVEALWPPKPALVLRRPKVARDQHGYPVDSLELGSPEALAAVQSQRAARQTAQERRAQARRDGERRVGAPA